VHRSVGMPNRTTTSPTGDADVAPAARRRRLRARSQRLLITLFGDYWQPGQTPLPSAGLVRVLEEFTITPANTRASLSRLTQRDLLCRTKDGRRTSYGLTDHAWRVLVRGARRIFADEDAPPWDGTWTMVAFSVPGADSEQRRLLRARLRWLTLWPLYDGSWVTPHDRVDAVQEQLDELAITDALVIRTREVELLPAARARLEVTWDLPKLAADYDAFIDRYRDLAGRAEDGGVTPADALVLRTCMVDEWRRMVRDDPDVPQPLLPEPFPRPRARALFLRAYRALEIPARDRFDRLVSGRTTAAP
jgi:phenylacetic acid degradation operon negative regulatory protein